MFLIRPRLGHVGWLSFSHTSEVVAEGYRAACEALAQLPECLAAKSGVYPRAAYRLSVDRDLCTGCGFCAAIAPQLMGMKGLLAIAALAAPTAHLLTDLRQDLHHRAHLVHRRAHLPQPFPHAKL